MRLTPYGSFLDCFDSAPKELFTHVIAECAKRGVVYVHMVTARVKGARCAMKFLDCVLACRAVCSSSVSQRENTMH